MFCFILWFLSGTIILIIIQVYNIRISMKSKPMFLIKNFSNFAFPWKYFQNKTYLKMLLNWSSRDTLSNSISFCLDK